MRKLLLTIALVGTAMWSQAQVIFAVNSPAGIAGNYEFTWADPAGGWGTPNFLIPNTFVEGDLMMTDDGSSGTNAQGNPISAEGCNPLVNDLTGKIAVIYRNTCEFGAKALNAQNAGAIGVVIINREPGVIEMGAGAAGASVTIPVAFLSDASGALMVEEMATETVNVFFGNKTGLYVDDAGIMTSSTLIAPSTGVPLQLAQNAAEFSFELGTQVFNYGTGDQANITVTATVDGPSGNLYTETVGPIAILSGDSVQIIPGGAYEFPTFSETSYAAGRYTVTYTVSLGTADEYDADNTISSDFVMQNSIFSLALIDETTGLPTSNNGYRPSDNTSSFGQCIVMSNPNASRLGVDGLYFSAMATGVDLSGEEISMILYRWDDAFADLNDANLAFDNLTEVASGFYYYPSDLQDETVYGSFVNQVVLEDDARYLACVQTFNLEVYLGFDTKTNYLWNEAYYLQPLTPIENDGAYFASGFGSDVVPAIGIRVFDAADLGINEEAVVDGSAYPNPAVDVVTVALDADGVATVNVTDLSGRTVQSTTVTLVNGKASLNIADLNSGAYIFNVVLEDGKTSQFNVVKK
jgi:hypothetical protein